MEYDLYHDESKESGYWHGILLVPRSTRDYLLEILENARMNIKYTYPVNFKGVNKPSGTLYSINYSWLTIGVSSLAQKQLLEPLGFYNGKNYKSALGRFQSDYETLKQVIGAKFIVMRVKDSHKTIGDEFFPDNASKIETTLRMGLKGGLHLLSEETDNINIKTLHFDGSEHYGRNLDLRRIVGRINPLRINCSIDDNVILDDKSSNHMLNGCQSYEDCQFIQLADILVGAFRTVIGECKNIHQKKLSYPVRELVTKWRAGKARMINSRWYNGFCYSACSLENGKWQFESEIRDEPEHHQLDLGI